LNCGIALEAGCGIAVEAGRGIALELEGWLSGASASAVAKVGIEEAKAIDSWTIIRTYK